MNKQLDIKNYELKLEGQVFLSNFSISLNEDGFVCLLGESGSGKTLLLKDLSTNSDCMQVLGKVAFYLGEEQNIINWKEAFHYHELREEWQQFLDKFMSETHSYTIRCGLISKLLLFPDFLFCEDLHTFFSREELQFLWQFLKSQHIGIFYVTNNIEDTIYGDYLIILKNNQIVMEGKTNLVLKEEKLMKLLGFSLPFYVNMSIQLGYYGLGSKLCFSKEELEAMVWQSK